jgi:hypothetical protein
MRNLSMAILAGGVLVGMTAAASAQNLASAVPAPQRDVVVFADKGSTLSPTAANVVRTAATEVGARQVILIGRADSVAPVKGELVRNGVAPQSIVVVKPEGKTIAKVADGLSDPADRRVEIKF